MNSHFKHLVLVVVGLSNLALLLGCTGEDEKPAPDFMAKPAKTEATTKTTRNEMKPDASPNATPREIANVPAPLNDPVEPRDHRPDYDIDNPPPSSLILDEFTDNEDDEWVRDEDEFDEFAEDEYGDHDPTSDQDDLAEEELDDENQEEEEDDFVFYGSRRPHVPAPLEVAAAPAPDSQRIVAPAPSEVVAAAVKWSAKPESEIEALLARERAAYPTPEEIAIMDRLKEIPTPPDPNPQQSE